jgi:hypothetical protein
VQVVDRWILACLAKIDLLVLDDWGLVRLNAEQRRDLLELLEDHHGTRATLVPSQLPVEHWHQMIGDPTLADAILDRLVQNAYKINLKPESLSSLKWIQCLVAPEFPASTGFRPFSDVVRRNPLYLQGSRENKSRCSATDPKPRPDQPDGAVALEN